MLSKEVLRKRSPSPKTSLVDRDEVCKDQKESFYTEVSVRTEFVLCLALAVLGVCSIVTRTISADMPTLGAPCSPLNSTIPLQTSLASAGFFANLRNADHSVRARTDQMLKDARTAAQALSERERGCRRPCGTPVVAVVFNSTPYRYLTNHREAAQCQVLLESTSRSPIVYERRRFPSDDEAREWYEELTQGDGADGEDLYRRCPGACSPAYSSVAYKDGEEFVVSTSIVCGHARDKDDNQYSLSTALRWMCPS